MSHHSDDALHPNPTKSQSWGQDQVPPKQTKYFIHFCNAGGLLFVAQLSFSAVILGADDRTPRIVSQSSCGALPNTQK